MQGQSRDVVAFSEGEDGLDQDLAFGVLEIRPVKGPRNQSPQSRNFVSNLFGDGFDGVSFTDCLLYTSPSPRDGLLSRMPSSA